MITQAEYNALIHAIWRIDIDIAEIGEDTPKQRRLKKERQTLSDLHNRLSMPPHLQPAPNRKAS